MTVPRMSASFVELEPARLAVAFTSTADGIDMQQLDRGLLRQALARTPDLDP